MLQFAPDGVRMRFLHHAVCSRDFALAFDHAMRLGAQPVAMATLHFTPY